MPLSRDLRELIECLNSNKVEYLVVERSPFHGTDFLGTPQISIS